MTERLGDQRWMRLLRGHNAIIREQVAAHEGFEVKSEGDRFMLAFGSARKALQCAAEIQRALAQRNESADEQIAVRIGLHTGEAIKEADDFFGKNVILAARIAGQAPGRRDPGVVAAQGADRERRRYRVRRRAGGGAKGADGRSSAVPGRLAVGATPVNDPCVRLLA